MEKAGPRNIGHWRPYLLSSMNDVDTKGIDCIAANVIPVDARYQHFTLVIVHEQSANHLDYGAIKLNGFFLVFVFYSALSGFRHSS